MSWWRKFLIQCLCLKPHYLKISIRSNLFCFVPVGWKTCLIPLTSELILSECVCVCVCLYFYHLCVERSEFYTLGMKTFLVRIVWQVFRGPFEESGIVFKIKVWFRFRLELTLGTKSQQMRPRECTSSLLGISCLQIILHLRYFYPPNVTSVGGAASTD